MPLTTPTAITVGRQRIHLREMSLRPIHRPQSSTLLLGPKPSPFGSAISMREETRIRRARCLLCQDSTSTRRAVLMLSWVLVLSVSLTTLACRNLQSLYKHLQNSHSHDLEKLVMFRPAQSRRQRVPSVLLVLPVQQGLLRRSGHPEQVESSSKTAVSRARLWLREMVLLRARGLHRLLLALQPIRLVYQGLI